MSGKGSAPPPAAGEGSGDPSMEDILASIRRILSDDEAPPAEPPAPEPPPPPTAAAPAARPVAPSSPARSVLALDASMLVDEEDPPAAPPAEVLPMPGAERLPGLHDDRAYDAPPAVPSAVTDPGIDMPAPDPSPAMAHAAEPLVAPEAAAATASSMGSLLRSIGTRQNMAVRGGGPTIEDLVREELRPALKAWLDTNLPPLVERLVRAEIERVVGRVDL